MSWANEKSFGIIYPRWAGQLGYYNKPKTFEDFQMYIDNSDDNIPLKAFEILFNLIPIEDTILRKQIKEYYEAECKLAKVYRPFDKIWNNLPKVREYYKQQFEEIIQKLGPNYDSDDGIRIILKKGLEIGSGFLNIQINEMDKKLKGYSKTLLKSYIREIKSEVQEETQAERIIAEQTLKDFPSYLPLQTEEHCFWEDGKFIRGKEPEQKLRKHITTLAKEMFDPLDYKQTMSSRNLTLELIKTIPESFIPITDFDDYDNKININKGVLEKKGKQWSYTLHEDLEEHLKTFNKFPVKFDPNEEGLEIDQVLSEIVGFEKVPLIYELIAYVLMSHVKYQKAFILYGPTESGKSTLLELMNRFLAGNDIKERGKIIEQYRLQDLGKRFRIANLMGKIMNQRPELPSKKVMDTEIFKMIVSDPFLKGELKNVQKTVAWRNRCKLLFSCNELPELPKDTGDDFWRRWILIPCYSKFKDKDKMTQEDYDDSTTFEKNINILEKVCTSEEFSGLLNHVLEAWIRLEEREFFKFDDLEKIKSLWQIDVNPSKLFVDEHCEIEEKYEVGYYDFISKNNEYREKEHKAHSIRATKTTQSLRRINPQISPNTASGEKKKYKGIRIKKDSPYCPSTIDIEQLELNTGIDQFLEETEGENKKIERIDDVDYSDTDRLL